MGYSLPLKRMENYFEQNNVETVFQRHVFIMYVARSAAIVREEKKESSAFTL